MPRNTQGGTGHKKLASKDCVKHNTKTRLSEDDEYEYYAQITAMVGGKECHVICQDGIKRLCHIRGKFSGKKRRDNILSKGIWVLVGLREFETKHEGAGQVCATSTTGKLNKLDKCDLLEIYSDKDKDYLKAVLPANMYDCFTNENSCKSQEINFDNNDSSQLIQELTKELDNGIGEAITMNMDEEEDEEVDFNDI